MSDWQFSFVSWLWRWFASAVFMSSPLALASRVWPCSEPWHLAFVEVKCALEAGSGAVDRTMARQVQCREDQLLLCPLTGAGRMVPLLQCRGLQWGLQDAAVTSARTWIILQTKDLGILILSILFSYSSENRSIDHQRRKQEEHLLFACWSFWPHFVKPWTWNSGLSPVVAKLRPVVKVLLLVSIWRGAGGDKVPWCDRS